MTIDVPSELCALAQQYRTDRPFYLAKVEQIAYAMAAVASDMEDVRRGCVDDNADGLLDALLVMAEHLALLRELRGEKANRLAAVYDEEGEEVSHEEC